MEVDQILDLIGEVEEETRKQEFLMLDVIRMGKFLKLLDLVRVRRTR